MVFLKTCYLCGARVEKLYSAKCEECLKEECPPILEIKPVNMKYCNSCKRIHYQNQLITKKDMLKRLPDIIKKNIVIDEHYKLNDLDIKDLTITAEKVSFDVVVDCSLQ